ncbi:MAG: heat shock protein DnaJ domain protein [Bacteriovoracaceae bacterium]|nr:heat shock protein DnaJ domain protein [Bacteriovoracaceae bacterium]
MISKEEFEALLRIIGNLSHYQLLKIGITASEDEVQDAFHREALIYHPDRYQGMGNADLLAKSKQVYARIVEAYRVLSNKTQREQYDQKVGSKLGATSGVDPDDEVTSVKFKKSATSPSGMKFFKLAQTALQSGNLQSAKMNIQLALNTDPENRELQQLSQRIETSLKKPK